MESERSQIVLKVQPLRGSADKRAVVDALTRLESVQSASVDVRNGIVRIDGASSDIELLAAMEGLGKHAVVITHTRGQGAAVRPANYALRTQLFFKLLSRQISCCSQ